MGETGLRLAREYSICATHFGALLPEKETAPEAPAVPVFLTLAIWPFRLAANTRPVN